MNDGCCLIYWVFFHVHFMMMIFHSLKFPKLGPYLTKTCNIHWICLPQSYQVPRFVVVLKKRFDHQPLTEEWTIYASYNRHCVNFKGPYSQKNPAKLSLIIFQYVVVVETEHKTVCYCMHWKLFLILLGKFLFWRSLILFLIGSKEQYTWIKKVFTWWEKIVVPSFKGVLGVHVN